MSKFINAFAVTLVIGLGGVDFAMAGDVAAGNQLGGAFMSKSAVIPAASGRCKSLAIMCRNKDEFGLKGGGVCKQFRAECGDGGDDARTVDCGALARACRDKDQLGLKGAGICKTFRRNCGV
jgi:hypothetical protein